MRVSGWLLGFIGFGALFAAAGICSLTAFLLTRQTVVDLQRSGILLDDPLAMLRCVGAGQCEDDNSSPPFPVDAPALALTPLFTAVPVEVSPVANATAVPTRAVSTAAQAPPSLTPTLEPERGLPRITDPRQIRILLLGIDQRSAAGESGPFRTDTMILMNIDPVRKTVGVLSLPRDLWVSIPDFEPGRINTANFIGDANAYPGGGGPALAMETVSANFGIRVDKYLLVNFDVFTAIVDALAPNGVRVTVTEFIDDPHYPDDRYGTVHVRFQPGEQRMDAETLLQYARTRATEGGDFDRARRQQKALDAVRAEVLSAGGILNAVAQAPRLWEELSNNYRTNLSYNEIIALGSLMSDIERENIRYEVVDHLYVSTGTNQQGEMLLYPDYAAISDLIQRVFFPQAQLSPAEIEARAKIENAPIHVFNGTNIIGLAGDTREWLTDRDVVVVDIGNDTTSSRQFTEIRDYGGGHTWTARYIAHLMGLPLDRIRRSGDGLIAQGVMVALGEDALAIIGG